MTLFDLIVTVVAFFLFLFWIGTAHELGTTSVKHEEAMKELASSQEHLASEEDRSASERARAEAAEAKVQEMSEESDRMIAERNQLTAAKGGLEDQLAAATDRITQLTATSELTAQNIEDMKAAKCVHCGGVHDIACPRVKRIRFRGDGATPMEVEFFENWPKDRVTFLEDILPQPEEVPAP